MSKTPLDVWLAFDDPEDDEATYEANTYGNDEDGFVIEWYHNAVGQVSSVWFSTYEEVTQWYEDNEFLDFTIIEDDGSTNADPGGTPVWEHREGEWRTIQPSVTV